MPISENISVTHRSLLPSGTPSQQNPATAKIPLTTAANSPAAGPRPADKQSDSAPLSRHDLNQTLRSQSGTFASPPAADDDCPVIIARTATILGCEPPQDTTEEPALCDRLKTYLLGMFTSTQEPIRQKREDQLRRACMAIAQVHKTLLPRGPGNVDRNQGVNNENIWRTNFKHRYMQHFLPDVPAAIEHQIAAAAAQAIFLETGFCDEHAAVTAYALARNLKPDETISIGGNQAAKHAFVVLNSPKGKLVVDPWAKDGIAIRARNATFVEQFKPYAILNQAQAEQFAQSVEKYLAKLNSQKQDIDASFAEYFDTVKNVEPSVMQFGATPAIKEEFQLKVRQDFKRLFPESGRARELDGVRSLIRLAMDQGMIDEDSDVNSLVQHYAKTYLKGYSSVRTGFPR